MRVLVIDTFSYRNHKYFNKLHIDTLIGLGNTVDVVGKEGQFDILDPNENLNVYNIPSYYYKKLPCPPVTERLKFIFCHLWLKRKFNPKNYDAVLMLVYEPLSIVSYRTTRPVLLFTHDGHYLDNKVKLLALKSTPKHYIHIGLSEEIANHLKELMPNRKVYHVPHGLYKPSNNLVIPSFINKGEPFLFCPINNRYEQKFVDQIICNEEFYEYLRAHNLKLAAKKKLVENASCEMIIPIENDIKKEEYDYMIQNAVAVILPYEKDYKYRCSGIMLECVIRDTPVLATRLDAWAYLKDRINIQLFDDVNDLIKGLDYFNRIGVKEVNKEFLDPLPYWEKVLSSEFNQGQH